MMESVYQTDLPGIPLFTRGKVRDVYDLDDKLLIVATDRISAYDVVMPNGIPGKGAVLTQMSLFWFDLVKDIIPNHLISADVDDFPSELQAHREILRDRSMLVRKAERYDIECVARGYITGSGWSEYKRDGKVCGIELPAGLQESQILDPPVFTPSTKAETGHDENITFEQMIEVIGDRSVSEQLRELTLAVY
ncbi:MAG: phosphoribosylaminoimidazolesuccinocarboxamide synthase, partial [Candidatus Latescibacteria bacterium]|nr:phosphoribosylaminoimidazolesuccinocarboxamide synthase [Candidatus Latescibacterota bacterium]